MTDHQDKSGKESRNFILRFFSTLGPGLVAGAADDDPSGIATYSIAGAQFGTAMLWTAALTWPLMAAVQMMCAPDRNGDRPRAHGRSPAQVPPLAQTLFSNLVMFFIILTTALT